MSLRAYQFEPLKMFALNKFLENTFRKLLEAAIQRCS